MAHQDRWQTEDITWDDAQVQHKEAQDWHEEAQDQMDTDFQVQLLALEGEQVEALWKQNIILAQAVYAMNYDCWVLVTIPALAVTFMPAADWPLTPASLTPGIYPPSSSRLLPSPRRRSCATSSSPCRRSSATWPPCLGPGPLLTLVPCGHGAEAA